MFPLKHFCYFAVNPLWAFQNEAKNNVIPTLNTNLLCAIES